MKVVLAAALLLAPALAMAQPAVTDAWMRGTPGSTIGVLYMTLRGSGAPDTLVSVTTPVADHTELHVSEMKNGVMTMRPSAPVTLSPDKPVTFAPGGQHVMLMGLKQPLVPGQSVDVTLHFEHAPPITTRAIVAKPGAATMPHASMPAMDHAMPGTDHGK